MRRKRRRGRALEAQEEKRRAQETREERRAHKAPELRRSEREVSAQEERTEQEREVEAQEGQEEDVNSVHDECHVSNRYMTWWHNAWWIRVDNGAHMRSAKGRRRTWRAVRQAAEQVRDGNRVGETWREEKERLKKGERQEERQHRKSNATLHLILHVSQQQHQQQQQQQKKQKQQQQQPQRGIRLMLLDRGILAHRPSRVEWPTVLENLPSRSNPPPVNVVDWTVKGAVTPVKNREQCDSR